MTDRLTGTQRSWLMSRIRSKDTQPELIVRSLLHRMGFRFSLRRKDLPGKPDVVLPRWRCVVFVHGCFWHAHEGCPVARLPKSRVAFWQSKLQRNAARDRDVQCRLEAAGWKVITVWECELKDRDGLVARLRGEIAGEDVAVDSTSLAHVAEDSVAYGRALAKARRGRIPRRELDGCAPP